MPETINDFIRASTINMFIWLFADIKVWMLTGDKLETAENIARSCMIFS